MLTPGKLITEEGIVSLVVKILSSLPNSSRYVGIITVSSRTSPSATGVTVSSATAVNTSAPKREVANTATAQSIAISFFICFLLFICEIVLKGLLYIIDYTAKTTKDICTIAEKPCTFAENSQILQVRLVAAKSTYTICRFSACFCSIVFDFCGIVRPYPADLMNNE